MQSRWLGVAALVMMFTTVGPRAAVGTARLAQTRSPEPLVTAATAAWQLAGEPVFAAGSFYDPSGPTVFFDGNVMVQTGVYMGVPLYVNPTLSPTDVVYVPVGRNLMRPYHRREGQAPPSAEPVPTASAVGPLAPLAPSAAVATAPAGPAVVESIPPANTTTTTNTPNGVWVRYAGARWRSAGSAVSYSPKRFVRVGIYHGMPVYRVRNGRPDEIYIPSVAGGPLAPFRKG